MFGHGIIVSRINSETRLAQAQAGSRISFGFLALAAFVARPQSEFKSALIRDALAAAAEIPATGFIIAEIP